MKIIFNLIFFTANLSFSQTEKMDKLSLIRDNLFKDYKENIYFRSSKINSENRLELVYRDHLSHPEDNPSTKLTLKNVIDIESWKQTSAFTYRDKNKIYYFTDSAEGGFLTIMENVNPDEIMFYRKGKWMKGNKTLTTNPQNDTQWYINDGSHIYYNGIILDEADATTFLIMEDVPGLVSGQTGCDKKYFFEYGQKVSFEEFKMRADQYQKSKNEENQKYAVAMKKLIKEFQKLQRKNK